MKAVEVLFFDGCPNIEIATAHAREAIARAGAPGDVSLIRIEGDADAVRQRFLGSPTIRVNGLDVDHSARARTDFAVQCRVYSVEGRLVGVPPVAWIEAELRGDSGSRGTSAAVTSSACCAVAVPKATPGR